jgi:hypothetical protein
MDTKHVLEKSQKSTDEQDAVVPNNEEKKRKIWQKI